MNKQQRKIFLKKILPKTIIIAFFILGLLSLIAFIIVGKYAKSQNDSLEAKELLDNTLEEGERKDSISIASLNLKYPSTYRIKEQLGDENMGEYTLYNNSENQLIIGYQPKINALGKTYTSVGNILQKLVNEYTKHVVSNTVYEPTISKSEYNTIGKYDIKNQHISFANETVHMYVFETNEHFIRLTSNSSSYLLNRIVSNITIENPPMQDKHSDLRKDSFYCYNLRYHKDENDEGTLYEMTKETPITVVIERNGNKGEIRINTDVAVSIALIKFSSVQEFKKDTYNEYSFVVNQEYYKNVSLILNHEGTYELYFSKTLDNTLETTALFLEKEKRG